MRKINNRPRLLFEEIRFVTLYTLIKVLPTAVDKTRNTEHSGTCRNIPEHAGTFRNIPEHPGTSRNIPEHEKIKIIFVKKNIIK